MKLRNKKTGEIGYTAVLRSKDIVVMDENAIQLGSYTSLAELNKEWEDAQEEPKEYWYIDDAGVIQIEQVLSPEINMRKSIGNYFETKEEAEKAVEKLEAVKRLKDKGFRFDCWEENHHNLGIIEFSFEKVENNVWDFKKDLDLLFGGKE